LPKENKKTIESFDVIECPLALTKNNTLEESLKELDVILQAELVSFDKIKNLLFIFDTYFLGKFNLQKLKKSEKKKEPETFGQKFQNLKLKSENKKDWLKRKSISGIFNTLIVMTEALNSLERMDFFSRGGPLFFARESARLCFKGHSGSKSSALKSLSKNKRKKNNF
jgi:hypothetical protein